MNIYTESTQNLKNIGANITVSEVHQQPKLWEEAFANYQNSVKEINTFLEQIISKNDKTKVIFTGAGTSAYVGDIATPFLNKNGNKSSFDFVSAATTDIVSSPLEYLYPDDSTILVSFARSGNSPESVAARKVAKQVVTNLKEIIITCNPEGELAKASQGNKDVLLLMMPPLSNDKGFAMTGSFSCMLLTSILIFDQASEQDKISILTSVLNTSKSVFDWTAQIEKIAKQNISRIVYLGTGALGAATREAQLKVLELTAGKIQALFDTSMGFRHGPKSFINDQTVVFDFLNNDSYSRQYDVDILEEVKNDHVAPLVCGVGFPQNNNFSGENFYFENELSDIPDGYLALLDILFAQTIAIYFSLKVENLPDTPSASGTVNRVVKGVTIHSYKE